MILYITSGFTYATLCKRLHKAAIMLAYIPIIAKRIRNEEKVLEEGLPGYKEYKQKVKYKVIPFIW